MQPVSEFLGEIASDGLLGSDRQLNLDCQTALILVREELGLYARPEESHHGHEYGGADRDHESLVVYGPIDYP